MNQWAPLLGSVLYVVWATGSFLNEGRPWFALGILCYAIANVALVMDSIQYAAK